MVWPQDPNTNQTGGQMDTSINMNTVVRFMVWTQDPNTNQTGHMGTSINMNTVVRFMVLPQDSSTNQTGGQMGTSITLNTVVRFMVWTQYPIPITWEGSGHQYQYEHGGQVHGLITESPYQSHGKLDAHQHQYTQWSGLWHGHSTPIPIRMELRWAPASIWTWWLKIKCRYFLLIISQSSRLYWAMLLVSSILA